MHTTKDLVEGLECPNAIHSTRDFFCTRWQQWFVTPNIALEFMTPPQAAKTEEGRQLLRKLLREYEASRLRMDSALDDETRELRDDNELFPLVRNYKDVPTKWALWKLGIVEGDLEDFVDEEYLFNYYEVRTTDRTEKSKKRLSKRHRATFVPKRCELEGCDEKRVNKCKRCHCAAYCSLSHQSEDWSRHKVDCKHLGESRLTKLDFSSEQELEKYPIGCFPLPDQPVDTELECFICGAGEDEVQIGFTDCCNAPVCDNEDEYEVGSYSRDFCKRSHRKYTCCGQHREHIDEEGYADDWRECIPCKNMNSDKPARSWHATNGYNLTPALAEDIPKGSYLTRSCAFPRCKRRIIPGHDVVTYNPSVRAEDGYTGVCDVCAPKIKSDRVSIQVRN